MKKIIALFFLTLPLFAFSQETFVSTTAEKKNVLFEEYTGASCGNCPRAHALEAGFLKAYPGRFFAVNIHAGGFATPYHAGDPDMSTEEGEELNNLFKITGYPAAVISRRKFEKNYDASENRWGKYIDSVLGQDALVNIAAKGQIDFAENKISLKVQMYYTDMPEQSEQFLHVVLLQDSIIAAQSDYSNYNPEQTLPDGNYIHLHVFRASLNEGGIKGDKFDVETGKVIEKNLEYSLPADINDVPLNLPFLRAVAFVTADSLFDVQNVCAVELEYLNTPDYILNLCCGSATPTVSCDPFAEAGFNLKNIMGKDLDTVTFKLGLPAEEKTLTHIFNPALKPGESGWIPIEKFALSASNQEENIKVEITEICGEAYTYNPGSTLNIPVTHTKVVVPCDAVILNLYQDQKGEEITWKLRKESGEFAMQGGPYEHLSARGTQENKTHIELEKTCYILTVYDAGGDGIRSAKYGYGYIELADWQDNMFYKNKDNYTDSLSLALDVRTAGNENIEKTAFRLYPNPASKTVFVEADEESYTVNVYGLSGVRVRTLTAAGGKAEINLDNLPCGTYIVEVRTQGGRGFQKLIVR